ncbi:hypothetical protein D915_008148 [Fasciola hepatica]|uniref:Reverse transcriptase domain-containing protein n=1 Tax=Fasciola hepatica TaxID=6192 RepID=A0A4E0RN94_FASHE|nr:hypothetical protein D915_008148 [Fasciola hepatica]
MDMTGSAHGIDRLTPEALLRYPPSVFTAYITVLLPLAKIPRRLNIARITFVPKSDGLTSPSDYSSISFSPVLLLSLHKVLQHLWTSLFPVEGLHFAFLKRDGAFKAIALLRTLP